MVKVPDHQNYEKVYLQWHLAKNESFTQFSNRIDAFHRTDNLVSM